MPHIWDACKRGVQATRSHNDVYLQPQRPQLRRVECALVLTLDRSTHRYLHEKDKMFWESYEVITVKCSTYSCGLVLQLQNAVAIVAQPEHPTETNTHAFQHIVSFITAWVDCYPEEGVLNYGFWTL